MLQVNQPNSETDQLSSMNHVAAIFYSPESLALVLADLQRAGFSCDELEVFVRAEGAGKLNFQGGYNTLTFKMLHNLALLLANKIKFQKKIDEALRSGAVLIAVGSNGEDKKKHRAALILKAHHGQEIGC